jgi:hypothetical protein
MVRYGRMAKEAHEKKNITSFSGRRTGLGFSQI